MGWHHRLGRGNCITSLGYCSLSLLPHIDLTSCLRLEVRMGKKPATLMVDCLVFLKIFSLMKAKVL